MIRVLENQRFTPRTGTENIGQSRRAKNFLKFNNCGERDSDAAQPATQFITVDDHGSTGKIIYTRNLYTLNHES